MVDEQNGLYAAYLILSLLSSLKLMACQLHQHEISD